MAELSYHEQRGRIEAYFDRTAAAAWARLTSDAPLGRIRASVRAGRERMRDTLLSWLPQDLSGARVLDAGCGLGHGLRALHAAWPAARIEGVEWSALLAWACARRCRFAAVRRGDLWAGDWRGLQLVYLFQRPESMARAWAKAEAELPRGAWLVSLEFAVPGVQPWRRLDAGGGRPLWLYRMDSKKCSDGR